MKNLILNLLKPLIKYLISGYVFTNESDFKHSGLENVYLNENLVLFPDEIRSVNTKLKIDLKTDLIKIEVKAKDSIIVNNTYIHEGYLYLVLKNVSDKEKTLVKGYNLGKILFTLNI